MDTDKDPVDDLIAFLDANIVLEGKPVAELPWDEVTTLGTIVVLIVPKAMEEIDAKKRDGRLGPHARAFNRLIAPSVTTDYSVVLREAEPRVELKMASCSRIKWDNFDELDPDDGDSRIVAEALHVRNVTSCRKILISHDIKPLAYAVGRGLAVHQASDAWLRPIEPSPKDKEIQRLKQQVAEFRKDEPKFEISIEIADINPAVIYKIARLEAEEAEVVTRTIRRNNLKEAQSHDLLSSVMGYDDSYEDKYSHYVTKTIPGFVANFHEKMEMLFNQRLLKIQVTNAGQIRADHLVVSVSTDEGWLNRDVVFVHPQGPAAPVPKPYSPLSYNGPTMRDLISPHVGRHEFEVINAATRSLQMETGCENFRSGQEYIFEGVVWVTSEPSPLTITVSLTATNLRGERLEKLIIEKSVVEVLPKDLVDFETLSISREYSIKPEFHRLIELKRYDDIEWDGSTNG